MNNNIEKIFVPVLLIAFNRPDTTCVVLEYIRRAKPSKLYVALDAARNNKPYEDIICREVRRIVENVDWECDVSYKINEINKGAEVTISEAIKWVFEKEEYTIILEDDIVASLSFFLFAQEMLIKYKDNITIGKISGINFYPRNELFKGDYDFSRYAHSWGWATWKRVWDKYSLDMDIDNDKINYYNLKSKCSSKAECKYWSKFYKQITKKQNNTWDYVANYFFRINNYINIIPKDNLVSNIGVYGLHASGKQSVHYCEFNSNFKVKNHPNKIVINNEFDKHHFKNHYIKRIRINIFKRVLRKILTYLS